MLYPTLTLPPLAYVVAGADPLNPTDEEDKAYNAHCTELVKDFAREHGTVRTHYPYDAPDGSSDDTVTLDDEGNVIVLDEGGPAVTVWPNGSKTIPRVSSEYGPRTHPVTGVPGTFHYGIDLGHDWDAVRSPAAGTIIFAGYNGGAGNEVRIRADNGDVFRLLHNRSFVRTSGRVAEGEHVAWMGTTGSSTGVHCHFETKPGGGATINPRDYMARAIGGSGAGSGGTPLEDDMPLSNADLQAILLAQFNVPGVGTVRVLDALGQAYRVPGAVWTHPLEHTLAKNPDGSALMTTAGDLLRFEPAEHANTRASVALVATGDFDYKVIADEIAQRFPDLDVDALAVAAADEADRRERERLGSE